MFVHIGKLNKPLLVVLFAFAVPLGAVKLVDCIHRWKAAKYPVVEGTVVKREPTSRWGIPGGRLTIQIPVTNTVVTATTSKTGLESIPDRVQFHYSGDPSREVFLDEGNPIWIVLLMWGGPVLLLFLYLKLKGKPGMETVID